MGCSYFCIIVLALISLFLKGRAQGWVFVLILFIITYVVNQKLKADKYKSARKENDKKVKFNMKEEYAKEYSSYFCGGSMWKLFADTSCGISMFEELKKTRGYPDGAIPDPFNYNKDYVVGEIVTFHKGTKQECDLIVYEGIVYNKSGSHFSDDTLGGYTPTVDNVKKYSAGGTEVVEDIRTRKCAWKKKEDLTPFEKKFIYNIDDGSYEREQAEQLALREEMYNHLREVAANAMEEAISKWDNDSD